MNRIFKRLLCVALMATMAIGIAACGSPIAATPSSTPDATKNPALATSQTMPEESEKQSSEPVEAQTYEPFSITTYDDAIVEFDHVPQRVVAANVNAGEELMDLGLGDKIIATSYNNDKIAEKYREEYESKENLTANGQPSLEVVLALNPDFIYGRSSAFGQKGIASHDMLTKNKIMSLSSIESYKLGADIEDVYQDFYNLGKIFKVEDKAEEVVSAMKTRLSAIEEKVKGVEPVKVFNFDMQTDSGAYTPGKGFTSNIIRRAGGVNIFEDMEKVWNTVSWESVLEANPDVIVINDYGDTTLEEKIQQLKTNPALSGLKAVAEENFIVVSLPEMFACARSVDTVEKLAKEFHPELFS